MRIFILWFESTVSRISVHPGGGGELIAPMCRNSNNTTRRAWVRRHPDETAGGREKRKNIFSGTDLQLFPTTRLAHFHSSPQQLISLFIIHLWTFFLFLFLFSVHVSQEWPGEISCQYWNRTLWSPSRLRYSQQRASSKSVHVRERNSKAAKEEEERRVDSVR